MWLDEGLKDDMNRRIIAVVASLLLAGAGTFVLLNFVRGAEERAGAGEELQPVWMVTQTIPQGTPGEDIGVFVQQELIPSKTIPSAAIGEDLSVLSEFVAEIDLVQGEILLSNRFVAPDEVEQRRGDAPSRTVVEGTEQLLQVPVRLDVEQALGGIIQPGDTVAILVSIDSDLNGTASLDLDGGDVVAVPTDGFDGEEGAEAGDDQYTGIIIHKALVAEVQVDDAPVFTAETGDAEVEASAGVVLAPSTSYLVTFALTPEDVERLVHGATYGTIWLAAQGEDAYDYPTPEINNSVIFDDTPALRGDEIIVNVPTLGAN